MKTFDAIIGYESVKRELRQVADMILHFPKYKALGAKMPKGVLLLGAPGVGKTLLATALLDEVGIHSRTIRHTMERSAFIEYIEDTFEEAAKYPQSIILLDDLDKFSMEVSNGEEFAVVQACIDKVADKNVFVIATANSTRHIPDSLLRAGRFDKWIQVDYPKGEDAVQIITHYMNGVKTEEGINYEDIAKMLSGKSCATLERVINEAAIEAGFLDLERIGMAQFVKATLTDVYGVKNSHVRLSDSKKAEIAYHEAGHAVIAEVLTPGYVGMLSLSSTRSNLGGFMLRCVEPERRAYEILVALGGKAACELQYGRIASGTGSDLEDACEHLMQSIGEVGNRGVSFLNDVSDRNSEFLTSAREQVIISELERYLFKAKEIIAANREFLDRVAGELLERETLLYSDMKRIRQSCKITSVEVG